MVKRPKNIKKIFFIKIKKSIFLLYFDKKKHHYDIETQKIMKKKLKK